MLDLRSMSDDEFTVLVPPTVPQTTMRVTVEESGKILLSSKVAAKLSQTPIRICFNQDYTAMQISASIGKPGEGSIIFPKNGRKGGLNAAEKLRKSNIPLPAVFCGYFCDASNKWRGERQLNPTSKPLPTSRSTKKK